MTSFRSSGRHRGGRTTVRVFPATAREQSVLELASVSVLCVRLRHGDRVLPGRCSLGGAPGAEVPGRGVSPALPDAGHVRRQRLHVALRTSVPLYTPADPREPALPRSSPTPRLTRNSALPTSTGNRPEDCGFLVPCNEGLERLFAALGRRFSRPAPCTTSHVTPAVSASLVRARPVHTQVRSDVCSGARPAAHGRRCSTWAQGPPGMSCCAGDVAQPPGRQAGSLPWLPWPSGRVCLLSGRVLGITLRVTRLSFLLY